MIHEPMLLAVQEASKYIGATAPNPPVGACLVKDGVMIAVGAHKKAGEDHAEVACIKKALETHSKESLKGSTLYVTLEPCNHQGKTPPCTKAILDAGIQKVVVGTKDINPQVAGGGASFLKQNGIEIFNSTYKAECKKLIKPFEKLALKKLPYIVHKTAFRKNENGDLSMIPDAGKKTFASEKSLKLAHEIRKTCDGFMTGIGTVLCDYPEFTVRHVPDHPLKKRFLVVVGNHEKLKKSVHFSTYESWKKSRFYQGLEVVELDSTQEALSFLGQKGLLKVLIEAGPKLSKKVIDDGLWDERVVIIASEEGAEDFVSVEYNETK